jgi:hypothetical protein
VIISVKLVGCSLFSTIRKNLEYDALWLFWFEKVCPEPSEDGIFSNPNGHEGFVNISPLQSSSVDR